MKQASAVFKLALGLLLAITIATSLPGSTALGLEERKLNYGNFELKVNDSLRFHGEYHRFITTLVWPVSYHERGTLCFAMPYFSYESLTMTTPEGLTEVVTHGWGYPWGSGIGGGMFIRGGEKGLMEWLKYYPPYFETDGIPRRPFPDEDDIDYTMGPDQRIELIGRAGYAGTRYHRFKDAWSNQSHDDYTIITTYHRPDWVRDPDAEVVVKHPAQVAIASFGDGYYYQPTNIGSREWNRLAWDIWYSNDTWMSWMVREVEDYGLDDLQGAGVAGNWARDSLLVNYGWDEENTKNTEEPYDLGDPSPVNGEFLAYQIPGNACLFASRAPMAGVTENTRPEDYPAEPDWYKWTESDHVIYTEIDDNRDPDGTISTTWADYYYAQYFAESGLTPAQINIGWQSQPVALWQAGQSSELWGSWRRNPANTWQFQTMPKRILSTFETGLDLNVQTISGKYGFLYYGPYCINKTDEMIRLVWAQGVGGVGPDSARTMGARWAAGTMTPEQKNELVLGGPFTGSNYEVWERGGRDSLFHTLERAYWNFLGRGIGPYDVTDPPPPPDLVVTSGPDRIDLKWWYPDATYYNDPDTGTDDFKEWRIYRKQGERRIGTPDEAGTTNPDQLNYVLVHTESSAGAGDTLRYADSDVARGQPYYYYVTAVDDGTGSTAGNSLYPGLELESSQEANKIEFAAVAFKPPADNTENIRVVPNPYNVNSGGANFSGSAFDANKVLFVNLPALCMIYIYTEAGELVKTINHSTRNADHAWGQLTDAGQYAKSGIYIAKITDATDEFKTTSYADAIVKFVIIR
ncbi:hypothetical protein ACFLT7_01315 [candidate division KSB1 bacterium]